MSIARTWAAAVLAAALLLAPRLPAAAEAALTAAMAGHADFVLSVAFSPDGTKALSGSSDTVRHAALRESPKARERFLTEARVISQLSHPFIVGIHELVEEAQDIYLVFDLIEGRPLSGVLEERGRLPLAECKALFEQVCGAVKYAHSCRILHRDLKPSNIMVDRHGHAKVMDFGLARQAKEAISKLTKQDTSGTLAYMAPEQHLGRATRASDCYALGVCVYESLTGHLPFKGPDFLAQKERMVFPPPRFLAPELPEAIDAFMGAALAADPAKRVADVLVFARALKAL